MTRDELIKEQESQKWIFTGKKLENRVGRRIWRLEVKFITRDDDLFYIKKISKNPNENKKVILHDHFASCNATLKFLTKYEKKMFVFLTSFFATF